MKANLSRPASELELELAFGIPIKHPDTIEYLRHLLIEALKENDYTIEMCQMCLTDRCFSFRAHATCDTAQLDRLFDAERNIVTNGFWNAFEYVMHICGYMVVDEYFSSYGDDVQTIDRLKLARIPIMEREDLCASKLIEASQRHRAELSNGSVDTQS